jgi:putative oxidoreductase
MPAPRFAAPIHPQAHLADHADVLLLLARLLYAADFLMFGSRKFSDPSIISNLSISMGYPGFLVWPAMALQLVGGLCLVLGLQTRIVAVLFAGFCIVAPSMFWLNNMPNLTRDYAAAGGFLLLMLCGAGKHSFDARWNLEAYLPGFLSRAEFIARTSLLARILIPVPFLYDGMDRLLNFSARQALLASKGLAPELFSVVLLAELVCGIMVLIGWRTRPAAMVLIACSAIQAWTLNHPHWNLAFTDGNAAQTLQLIWKHRSNASFFKDITTIAALLLLLACSPGQPKSRT